jgi:hypothetical protein
MRRSSFTLALWPGLPQLWRGDWSGLALAIGFAILLNSLLLCTLIWTELVGQRVQAGAWLVVGSAWLVSAIGSGRAARRRLDENFSAEGDLFPAAVSEYLQGNWVPAERLLDTLVRKHPRDVDARLMLATLWRHTGRLDEARVTLDDLRRLEESQKWELEIRRESRLLDDARLMPKSDAVLPFAPVAAETPVASAKAA